MRIRLACAAGLLLSLPATVMALWLGPLQTNSSLNEPFESKIFLVDAKVDELDLFKVGLASRASTASKATAREERVPNVYGPTRAGDTLWRLALDTRPPIVNVQQMMIALLKTNPGAFVDDNINRLKQGQILRIPDAAAISSVTPSEGLAAVRRQNALWEEYRQHLAEERKAAGKDESVHLRGRLKEAEDLIELLRRQVQLKHNELAALRARLAQEGITPVPEQPPEQTMTGALNERATTPATPPRTTERAVVSAETVPDKRESLIPGDLFSIVGVATIAGLIVFWVFWRKRGASQSTEEDEVTVETVSPLASVAEIPTVDTRWKEATLIERTLEEEKGGGVLFAGHAERTATQSAGTSTEEDPLETERAEESATTKDNFVVVEDLMAPEEVVIVNLAVAGHPAKLDKRPAIAHR